MVKTFKKHAVKIALETSGLNLPKSLLIIPDGNGRWAKSLGKNIEEGHRLGGKVFSKILKDFVDVNIEVLGAWAFSEDNWKRDEVEINNIMSVVENTIKENLDFMLDNKIKFIVLGKRDKIASKYSSLITTIENAEQKTEKNSKKTLAIFLDYGERFQLEEFAKARIANPELDTYELLSKINRGLPLFDMVLRTSGENRMSGFGPLASLAEFVTTGKNLPDLEDEDIIESLKEFSGRQRRFGGR